MKSDEKEKLIEEFKQLKTEPGLLQWERKIGRDKIKEADFEVKDAFDKHWTIITGSSYFTAVTDIEMPTAHKLPAPGRIDPKSSNYKTSRRFHTIFWTRNVWSTGKGFEREEHKSFDLSGLHGEDDQHRIIVPRCKPERLHEHLGEELAKKISSNQKKGKGEIKDIEVDVMVEGHWEVLFAGKGSTEDKEDPELSVEGHCLQVQRDVPVILPGRFVEANDNATHPIYVKVGDQPRKAIGSKKHYPTTVLREVTKKEYDEMYEEGNLVTQLARKNEG